MHGAMKFVNQKDEKGLNILLNENDIFSDVMVFILGDGEKTQIYTHADEKTIIQIKDI